MQRFLFCLAALGFTASSFAAERHFTFSVSALNRAPEEFRSVVSGEGKPGDWKIIEDEMPSAMRTLTAKAPVVSRHAVLAQLARDPADEHFPILVFDGDTYGDFTLTTRFKLAGGAVEQMAGIAFRMQDERNFYVIRASGLGNNLRFYKMVGGLRSNPIGPDVTIPKGEWHELKITCKGNEIRAWLDGKETIPPLTDNSFAAGKIGFWTKSDSVAYFGDTDLTYTPRVPFAQAMINDVMKQNPRLRGVKIFTPATGKAGLKVIAANQPADLGQAGGTIEEKVFQSDATYQSKERGNVTVVMPLRDRNGENVAAVHLVMESFPGQTEQNILARGLIVMRQMQARIRSAKDLTD